MKKALLLFLFSCALISCHTTPSVQLDEEVLLQEELDKIDWSNVDSYPSVEHCDSLKDTQDRKECFFQYMTHHLQQRLNVDTLRGNFDQLDTLKVMITIEVNARVDFQLHGIPDSLHTMTKPIDTFLHEQGKVFDAIQPALKRGVAVKTQFVVPLILNKQ